MPKIDLYEEIGKRIRQAREAKQWTQGDLGEYMTPPRTHAAVSDIERGKTHLDVNELVALSELLEVPAKTLFEHLSLTAYFPPLPIRPFSPTNSGIQYTPGAGWIVVLEGEPQDGMVQPQVEIVPVVAFMFSDYSQGIGTPLIVDAAGGALIKPPPGERVLSLEYVGTERSTQAHDLAASFPTAQINAWRTELAIRRQESIERQVRFQQAPRGGANFP